MLETDGNCPDTALGFHVKTPRVHNAALQKRSTIIMKSGIQSLDVQDNLDYP
jgi:hypothetical protein